MRAQTQDRENSPSAKGNELAGLDDQEAFMFYRVAAAAALLLITTACGSSSNPNNPTPSGGGGNGTPVSIVGNASNLTTTAYAPNPVTVSVGGSVTWKNNDNTARTSTANNGAWSSGSIAPGGSFTATFPTAGTFTYRCTFHPGMTGTVTVNAQ